MKIPRKRQTKGAKTAYVCKGNALARLGVELPTFRKLCIIKGVYPHDHPKLKDKKRQYYLKKDISHLRHDPLLLQMRAKQIHEKKTKRAYTFYDDHGIRTRERRDMPRKLDHIVRERYPTFNMALRDLDDCLTLQRIISKMPCDTDILKSDLNRLCRRLTAEFM